MYNSKLPHILGCHPIVKTDIIRGKDTKLFTKDGKTIIDFEAGMWCTALGHSNPKINTTTKNQLEKIVNLHYKLTSYTAETLAVNLLKQLHFKDGKAVFLSSGSEAVELGMRIAKMVSNGNKILTFSTSYLSAFSNTSIPRDQKVWAEINFLQCNNCSNKSCTSDCELLKGIDFNNISVFILESASCGIVRFPPYKLVKFLSNETKRHGGVIIANEVTTGLGRTGKWFGYNHYDLKPDIITLGKSLGNGYPISAVVMSKEIANIVEMKNFGYAQSHQNDPLGCAIANEVINILREDNIVNRAECIGNFFINQLKEIQNGSQAIKDVRGRGLMLAVELNIENTSEIISNIMLEKGYFIGTTPSWNLLKFFPALTISKNDISNMCKTLKDVLKQLERSC